MNKLPCSFPGKPTRPILGKVTNVLDRISNFYQFHLTQFYRIWVWKERNENFVTTNVTMIKGITLFVTMAGWINPYETKRVLKCSVLVACSENQIDLLQVPPPHFHTTEVHKFFFSQPDEIFPGSTYEQSWAKIRLGCGLGWPRHACKDDEPGNKKKEA